MHNFTFRETIFFYIICLFFNLPFAAGNSKTDGCFDDVIELQSDHSRHTVFLPSTEKSINICNLKVGKKYSIIVSSFDQHPDCIFEITHPKDKEFDDYISENNRIEFLAVKECMEFVIRNANCITDTEYPVDLSISCIDCNSNLQNLLQLTGITTDPNYTTQQLIEDVFIGGGCFEISNVTPIGNAQGRGYFSNGSSSIGIEEGVILASGDIANAHGPNDVTNITTDFFDGSGDPDLNILTGGSVFDDVGIEFDFTPTLDMIEFNYVFASDEYCDYVNTQFNDVFGFFISGPGINGGFTFGGENIALVPGTNLNVSINNVNIQTNSSYYVDNVPLGQPQQGPFPCTIDLSQQGYAINDCEYDGFTTVLTAEANVQVCETYHIRLVVGDVGDGIFDSAVFLEANSFSAGGEASMDFDIAGIETNGVAYEGCSGGYIIFERPEDSNLSEDLVVEFSIDPGSTATNGVDFTTLPSSIIIPAGQTQYILPFDIFNDDLTEGIETLILNLANPCTCDEASIDLDISDMLPLEVATPDMEFCSPTTTQISATVEGGVLNYTYLWSNGMTTPTVTVTPGIGTNTYTVTVTDECGNTEESTSTITVFEQEFAAIDGFLEVCNGDPEGDLTITFDGEGPWDLVILLDGIPVDAFVGLTENPFIYTVSQTGTYTIGSLYVGPCPGVGSGAGVVIETLMLLFPIPVDVSCFDQTDGSVFLSVAGGAPEYTYAWSNDTYEQNATNLSPGVYSVTVTDLNGCTEEASAEIFAPDEIIAVAVETQGVDCIDPNSGAANLTVTGGNPGYSFEWDNGSTEEDPTNLSAGLHTVTVTDSNGCIEETTVDISYESTPPVVEAEVSGILTCEVSEVTLDGSGSSGNGLTFEWFDENGILISNNPQINVSDTGAYTLVVTNSDNGCTADVTVLVEQDVQEPDADAGEDGILNCNDTQTTLDGSGSSTGNNFTYSWLDESNTIIGDSISVDVNAPGTYTLIVTNIDNGCTFSDQVTVDEDIELPTPEASVDNMLTCATTDATLDGSGSLPNGLLSFQWLDGSNTEISDTVTAEVTSPGGYTLIITNTENGCTNQTSIEVLQDIAEPTAEIEAPDLLSCSTNTVQLDANPSNGSGGLSYLWVDPNGNEIGNSVIVDVNTPGTYTLVVTNTENGCTDQTSVLVEQDTEAPTPIANVDGILTCINQFVTLDASSSGNGNINFEWFDANNNSLGTDPVVEAGAPGIYSVLITNIDNGCTATEFVEVDQDIASPTADAGQGGILSCDITSISLDGSNSSGSNLTFQWYNQGGSVIGDQPQIQVSETGQFTLVVTNSVNGCSSSSVVEVTPDENLPVAIIGGGGLLTCEVLDVLLDGSASSSISGLMSLEWLDPNDQSLGNNPNITVSVPGIYTLIVTDDENGCAISAQVEVPQDIDIPIVEAGENDTLSCSLTELTLTGSGTNADLMTFEWLDGLNNPISNNQNVVITSPGVYTLIITNTENGCTGEDEVEIVPDNSLPVAIAGPGGTLTCVVDAVILNAAGSSQGNNFSYEWQSPGGNTISTDLQIEVNQPGTYTFVVTNTDNGCTAENEVEVLQDISIPFSDIEGIGPLEINCNVSSVILDGSNSMPFGMLDFEWTTGNGNITTDPDFQQIEIDQPGIYVLTVTNLVNGCTDSATFEITDDLVPPSAVINPPPVLTCTISQVQITAINTSGNGTFAYQWTSNPAGGILSGANSLNPVVNQSGTFTLTILNQENGCESVFFVTVDEDIDEPDAQASVDDELDCVTDEVQLNGSGSSTGAIFNYQWTGTGIIQGATTLQPVVNQSGLFTLIVTNTENGCTNSADVIVNENTNVPSAVDVLVTPPPCPGDEGSLEIVAVSGGEAPYLYSIDGGENFYNLTYFSGLEPGIYPITIQDAIGCMYEDEIYIPDAQPIYVVTELDLEIQLGDTVRLEALVNVPLSEIDTIIWTPAEYLSCSDCLQPYAFPNSTTEFTIIVINNNGCMATDKITLRVKKDRNIYIPNAFTPHNNDGINDVFMIYSDGKSVKNINSFQVFDRWGELVFEDYDFHPDDPAHSWNGWLKEEPLNPAVFAYWAEIEFIDGVKILYKGDVTLLR